MTRGRRFQLPEGLTPDEERAILLALERYFRQESPRPDPWVLRGRLETTGLGALQGRRLMDLPWTARLPFARPGVPPLAGRGDAR